MRLIVRYLLYAISTILMFVLVLPFKVVSKAFSKVGNLFALHLYYPVVVLRRKVNGEPLWQKHDSLLGIQCPVNSVDDYYGGRNTIQLE